jgi:prefoldin subunit 5
MSDEITTARELATHANDIKHLQDDMDAMKADISEIKSSLADIQKTLASAQGGWKVLIAVGSMVSAVIGAFSGYFTSKGF